MVKVSKKSIVAEFVGQSNSPILIKFIDSDSDGTEKNRLTGYYTELSNK